MEKIDIKKLGMVVTTDGFGASLGFDVKEAINELAEKINEIVEFCNKSEKIFKAMNEDLSTN